MVMNPIKTDRACVARHGDGNSTFGAWTVNELDWHQYSRRGIGIALQATRLRYGNTCVVFIPAPYA